MGRKLSCLCYYIHFLYTNKKEVTNIFRDNRPSKIRLISYMPGKFVAKIYDLFQVTWLCHAKRNQELFLQSVMLQISASVLYPITGILFCNL